MATANAAARVAGAGADKPSPRPAASDEPAAATPGLVASPTPAGGARGKPAAAVNSPSIMIADTVAVPDIDHAVPQDEESAFTQFARHRNDLSSASPTLTSPPPSVLPAATPHRPAGRGASPSIPTLPENSSLHPDKHGFLWKLFSCFRAPEVVPRSIQRSESSMRPRRTLSKQVSIYAGPRRTITSVKSTYSDAQWFDTLSRFDSSEVSNLSQDIDAMLREAGTVLPTVQEAGPFVPDPPLEMADRNFIFVPVPEETGFDGYWVKDVERTTPDPQPIDVMLGASKMVMKAHETIPGIWLHDQPHSFTMTAKPKSIPLGPLSRYVETFTKDGAPSSWSMRRDIKVGRSTGQLFFTACGTLILRVYAKGLFSSEPEYVTEEYCRLEDEGNTIVSRQCCKHFATGRTAVQYLVGEWEARPPAGYGM